MISCDIYEIRGVCQQLEFGTKLQTQCIVAQGWGKIALTSAVGLSFLKKGGDGNSR